MKVTGNTPVLRFWWFERLTISIHLALAFLGLLLIAHPGASMATPNGSVFADLQPSSESLVAQLLQNGNYACYVEEDVSLIFFRKTGGSVVGIVGYGGDNYCFRGVLMGGEKIVIKKISDDYLGKRLYELRFGMRPHAFPDRLNAFDVKCFQGGIY